MTKQHHPPLGANDASKTSTCFVTFRLIHTPCCGALLCYVNPRLPNFCSECGERIFARIKAHPEVIIGTDNEARLTVKKEVFDSEIDVVVKSNRESNAPTTAS